MLLQFKEKNKSRFRHDVLVHHTTMYYIAIISSTNLVQGSKNQILN